MNDSSRDTIYTVEEHPMSFVELLDVILNRGDFKSIFANEVKDYSERAELPHKRQIVWDYFFHSNYEQVGKAEETLANKLQLAADRYISDKNRNYDNAIALCCQNFDRKINNIVNKQKKVNKMCLSSGAVVIFILVCVNLTPNLLKYLPLLPAIVISAVVLSILSIHFVLTSRASKYKIDELRKLKALEADKLSAERSNDIADIHKQCKSVKAILFKEIALLRRMIPDKPKDEEIINIIKEDAKKIRAYAMERMALTIINEQVDDFMPSDEFPPFCEPALLQHEAPDILNSSSKEHLEAMQRMNNGEDVYVVNYYKYILPSQHQLCVYSTFYNHITDNMYGEFTDSFCIQDFVSFSTRTQSQNITLRGEKILLANAMIISMSLTSGEKIVFNIRNEDFRRNIAEIDFRQEMQHLTQRNQELNNKLSKIIAEDETSTLVDEIKRELKVAEQKQVELLKKDIPVSINSTLENVVRFLRKQLKEHKS